MTKEELDFLEWKHGVLNRINPTDHMESVTTTASRWDNVDNKKWTRAALEEEAVRLGKEVEKAVKIYTK